MKQKAESNIIPALPQPWQIGVLLLLITALGISLFLLWGALTGERLPGCGVESGCDTVLHSRWAYLFGLPVSLPAALLYAATLGVLFIQKRTASPLVRQRTWNFLCFAAAAVLSAALWFIGLQLLVIQAICPFCMTAHVCGVCIGLILLAQVPSATPVPASANHSPPNRKAARKPAPPVPGQPGLGLQEDRFAKVSSGKFALAGLASVILLSIGQAVHQPKSFMVQAMTDGGQIITNLTRTGQTSVATQSLPAAIQATPSPTNQSEPQPKPAPHRLLLLHGDAFALNLNDLPVLGSPHAPHVIVHLFDYSCHYCRQLHPILTEAYRKLSNDLAIVSLPMPLDSNCNRIIKRRIPDHTNGCEYARIGLAVWRAQQEKLAEFDDWIFTPPRPPAPAAARAEAMRLVGSNAFERALSDPWIQQQLDLGIRLFTTNHARYRKSNLPQLMIGTNLVTGVIRTNDFYRLLTNQFDLRLPSAP